MGNQKTKIADIKENTDLSQNVMMTHSVGGSGCETEEAENNNETDKDKKVKKKSDGSGETSEKLSKIPSAEHTAFANENKNTISLKISEVDGDSNVNGDGKKWRCFEFIDNKSGLSFIFYSDGDHKNIDKSLNDSDYSNINLDKILGTQGIHGKIKIKFTDLEKNNSKEFEIDGAKGFLDNDRFKKPQTLGNLFNQKWAIQLDGNAVLLFEPRLGLSPSIRKVELIESGLKVLEDFTQIASDMINPQEKNKEPISAQKENTSTVSPDSDKTTEDKEKINTGKAVNQRNSTIALYKSPPGNSAGSKNNLLENDIGFSK